VLVFAMADRKGFKEWGEILRKKHIEINQEKKEKKYADNLKEQKEQRKG